MDRRRRARALNLGDKDLLAARLDELGELPEVELLRPPEPGLVMIRGRVGGSGAPFNLGEVLVTRASVLVGGLAGHGFAAGDDARGALMAALADALALDPIYRPGVDRAAAELEERLRAADEAGRLETEATRVEFLTLRRGDD
jgi:alpha-D-ribose 1-methylphosphonate 5-triphosphate synthase subunit PhnG